MPPPQCPECGRFLATAFVESIRRTPAPCPRCGTELSLDDEVVEGDEAAEAVEEPAAAPPADDPGSAAEPEDSVRPPDRDEGTDPLAGWDQGGTSVAASVGTDDGDPAVLVAGAAVGGLLGLLLGGRGHRGLGTVLGAVLGALVARLRG